MFDVEGAGREMIGMERIEIIHSRLGRGELVASVIRSAAALEPDVR